MSKLVVIIQCDTVQQRCCGYNCTHAFYSREGKFAGYPEDTHYMSFTCGGCSGGALTVKLENLAKRLRRFKEDGQEICVHLSTCMVSDNSHKPPCPHLDYIQKILAKKKLPILFMVPTFPKRQPDAVRKVSTRILHKLCISK